jgi:hypothetical protein
MDPVPDFSELIRTDFSELIRKSGKAGTLESVTRNCEY